MGGNPNKSPLQRSVQGFVDVEQKSYSFTEQIFCIELDGRTELVRY